MSKEGLQKLKLASNVNRQGLLTQPHKTASTYQAIPRSDADSYRREYANIRRGSHLK